MITMKTNEQPERRRRSMLITPGEAKRPGAAMRLRYLPPAVSIHRVELEKSIGANGSIGVQSVTLSNMDVEDWVDKGILGDEPDRSEGGNINIFAWK
jgi:hypothetical protein